MTRSSCKLLENWSWPFSSTEGRSRFERWAFKAAQHLGCGPWTSWQALFGLDIFVETGFEYRFGRATNSNQC